MPPDHLILHAYAAYTCTLDMQPS